MFEIVFYVIVATIAAWRISYLIGIDDGPFDIFEIVRVYFGVYAKEEFETPRYQEEETGIKEFFGRLIECVYCNSIWTGTLFAVLLFLFPVTTFYVLLPFVISAGAIFIDKWHEKLTTFII